MPADAEYFIIADKNHIFSAFNASINIYFIASVVSISNSRCSH